MRTTMKRITVGLLGLLLLLPAAARAQRLGFVGFEAITTGTNTTATMTCNTGCTINGTGTFDFSSGTVTPAAEVRSLYWGAGSWSADGTQCADPAEVTINSGPKLFSVICADNDASTIYGSVVMPDSWDAGTLTFELSYVQTAADTAVLNADVACQARGATEAVNSTWGTEIAIDDAALTGSNAVDMTTSAAVTCDCTTSCVAGDIMFWRIQLDATGTTTAVATLHLLGVKAEYTSEVGD